MLISEEDYVQHYGVMGMKWGVRRDQRSLDRAAGRKVKAHRKSGGASTAPNRYVGTSRDIRESRAKVSAQKKNMRKISKKYRKADSAEQKAKFEAEYAKAVYDLRTDHNLQRANNLTFGELATIGILGTPMMGIAAYAISTGNAGRIARRGNELNLASDKKLMSMKVDDLIKESNAYIEKEAKKG